MTSAQGVVRRLGPSLGQNLLRLNAGWNAHASSRLLSTGLNQQDNSSTSGRGLIAAAAALVGVGAVVSASNYPGTSAADAPAAAQVPADPYARPAEARPLPSRITLYQYEVCPYCCKVRALLDYYKLPYTSIEVNPLTKGELSWSSYKKVPVVKLDDEVVLDSSAIMSRLATDVAAARAAAAPAAEPAAPAPAPAPPAAPAKRSWSLFGGGSSSTSDAQSVKDQAAAPAAAPAAPAAVSGSDLEEEVKWRKWVDEKLVKVLTANIYRNWDESVETFKYITEQTSWSWGTRELARWAGAVIMWQVGKRMPAKYGIEGDLRTALYGVANDFVDNALRGRRFAGGEQPNLADVSAFGVIRAVRLTGAFQDLMANSRLAPWYAAMEQAVGDSARANPAPGAKA